MEELLKVKWELRLVIIYNEQALDYSLCVLIAFQEDFNLAKGLSLGSQLVYDVVDYICVLIILVVCKYLFLRDVGVNLAKLVALKERVYVVLVTLRPY